jgi:hypothetical protein
VLRDGLADERGGRLCLVLLATPADGLAAFVSLTVTPIGGGRCVHFLENAGVHPRRRGRGAFAAVWSAALERAGRHARLRGLEPAAVVFEIEPPDPAADDPVRNRAVPAQARLLGGGVPARRGPGAALRLVPYAQPAVGGGDELPVLLLLVPMRDGRPDRAAALDASLVEGAAGALLDQYAATGACDGRQVEQIRDRVARFLEGAGEAELLPVAEALRLLARRPQP